ncbi:unnamed protein product [Mytilus edulis]|uniref:Uncharacterized protein n=1 Tax=Mytilus edulis TaxID=6550 RepID=A0A8S3TPT1_MYTED|nr:unnamed protein product [Mytilus edulis]
MLSYEEKESMWLFGVLDFIGVNNEYRMKSQKAYGRSDMDFIMCDETLPVIEDIAESCQNPLSLLIVRESNTPGGYVKLQLVINDVPCTHIHLPNVWDVNIPSECLTTDSLGRIVLFDIPSLPDNYIGSRCMNKPSEKHGPIDIVQCFRQRLFGRPLTNAIQEIASLGCVVVKKDIRHEGEDKKLICIKHVKTDSLNLQMDVMVWTLMMKPLLSLKPDMDCITCDETLPVIEDISEAGQHPLSLLNVREYNTSPGYVKRQLVINGVPCTHRHLPNVWDVNIPLECLKTDNRAYVKMG